MSREQKIDVLIVIIVLFLTVGMYFYGSLVWYLPILIFFGLNAFVILIRFILILRAKYIYKKNRNWFPKDGAGSK